MKSIRRHLLLWLIPGFALLWVGAGVSIFQIARQGWETRLDADLRELRGAIPLLSGGRSTGVLRFDRLSEEDRGNYFQIWTMDGTRLLKSENLGQFELPFPAGAGGEPGYGSTELGNGDRVRLFMSQAEAPGLGTVSLVVAKSWEEGSAALRRLLLWIVLAGIAGGLGFAALLALALRSGLNPLLRVGEEARQMDAGTLSTRFPVNGMPHEILPITDALNGLLERLQESFVRERRFSADLAHELRNPIAGIRTTAEVALKWPEQADSEDYEDVLAAALDLQNLVEQLLLLARAEKAGDALSVKDVDLRLAVEEVWKGLADRAAEREIGLDLEIPPDEKLRTDASWLGIILSNLLSNAVEYAPEGTRVSVGSNRDESGEWLSVSNPAPELREEDLSHLFDRLWRRDPARTDGRHSGLGLSLARSCAEALSLELTARLEEGGMVRFSLRPSEKEAPPSSSRHVGGGNVPLV